MGDPGPHDSGESVSFTVTIANAGPGIARDIRVLDRLNDLFFDDSVTTAVTLGAMPPDTTCNVVRGSGFYSDLTCTITELAVGESRAITFSILAGGNTGTKTNTAETYSTLTPDFDFSNNTDSDTYEVTARTDLIAQKTASHADGAGLQAGQQLIYEISARVNGNGLSDAEGATLTDDLPAGLRIVSITPPPGASCQPVTGLVNGITTAGSQLECSLGTIVNGTTRTVEIVTVPATALVGATITNAVSAATTTNEIDLGNNSDNISHQINQPSLDLITNKIDSADPLEIGNQTVYTVTVRNAGPSEAFNLVITDILPNQGMRYDSVTPISAGLICVDTTATPGTIGGELICSLPNLPVNATASFQLAMTAMERGEWTNRAEARSDEFSSEILIDNNDVDETTTVFERADLRVTKAASSSPVDLNEPFDWNITVENVTAAGIGLAEGVRLTDTLPANMEITGPITFSSPGGTGAICSGPTGGRDVLCVIDDMSAGDRIDFIVPVRVISVTATSQDVSNTATVSTESFEQNPADNSSTGLVQVRASGVAGSIWRDFNEDQTRDPSHDGGIPGLTVTLSGTDDWGSAVSRTVTTAADGSYNFALLPPGIYQISYAPPAGDAYVLGTALPGAVGGGAANGATQIQNVTATTDAPSDENDFTLIPQAHVALAKQVSAPVFQADGSYQLTYTFRVRNESLEPLANLTLTDDLLTAFGTYVTGTPNNGEFSVVSVSSNATLDSGTDGQLVLSTPDLNVGPQRQITMVLRINPALPRTEAVATHTNHANVEGEGAWSAQSISDGSNNGSSPQRGVNSDTTRQVNFAPAITLDKVATLDNGGGMARSGDQVLYTFTVTNSGNTPLVDITITDPLPGLVWDTTGPIVRLDPGASDSSTFTAHYFLTQDDVESGQVENTATTDGRWAIDGVTGPIVSDSDDAAITTLAEPGLNVTKAEVSNNVQNPTRPGDTIRYEFTVTNTGNVALNDLVLTDALAGIVADPAGSFAIGTLAPAGEAGDSVTFHADYAVTQDDIDAASVLNSATVDGNHGPDKAPVSADSNEVETPLNAEREMRVTKLTDPPLPTEPQAGDEITWTITIANIGNTRLEIGTITEPLPDTVVSAPAQAVLQPGESTTATATHVLSQAEIDSGELRNQVTVSGKVPGPDTPFTDTPSGNDPDTPNEDETVTPLPAGPSIALRKVLTSDVSGPLLPGDEILFDFTIRNTGNVTLTNLVLTDHLAGVVLDDAVLAGLDLAPGAEVTLGGTYVLNAADIEAGGLTNTATATGDDPHGTEVSDDSGTDFDNDLPTPVDLIRDPQIALTKIIATAPADPVKAGDMITYAFEIRNTGNVELRDIALRDLVGGVTLSGSRTAPLPVGEVDTTSFTGSYTLTQADIDAGIFANSAEVAGTGTGPDGDDLVVTDISGTDLDNDDPTELPIAPQPALTILKQADDSAINSPAIVGDEITYSFTVTNTGNVTLTDVTVTDPLLGIFPGNVIASLGPGAEQVVTATYAVTQADIEAGVVINQASTTGDYFDPGTGGSQTTPPALSEEVTVPLDQEPRLAVVKIADSSGVNDPARVGDQITYNFTVYNIGNVAVANIVLTDPLPGLSQGTFNIGNLAAGAEESVSATYTVTQADIDAGQVVNQATATGEHGGNPVSDLSGASKATDEETIVPLGQGAALLLEKSADGSALTSPAVVGQQISYEFTVTNNGNVTIRNVMLGDPLPGLSPNSFALGDLAPGATVVAGPAFYAITEADIIAGRVINRALVSGEYGPPGDPQVIDTPSTNDAGEDGPNVVPVAGQAGIALVKELDPAIDPASLRLGDEIRWHFTVTNTGNVPLSEVTISEIMIDATISGGPVSLAVGESDSTSFTASHVIALADMDAGQIVNQARADGVFVDGDGNRHDVSDLSGTAIDNDDPTRTELTQRPAIDLVKTVDTSSLSSPPVAGDLLRYAFAITNIGEVTLQDVTVTDPMPGLVLNGLPIASLAPGATDSTTYTAIYTLTQEDIDSGAVLENQAQASGDYRDSAGNSQQVTDLSGTEAGTDQPTRVEITRQPGLELIKSADDSAISQVAQVGEEIIYTFTVINIGNTTLTNITIDDPLPGLVLAGAPIASLAPGETSAAITGRYAITSADIIAAGRDNTATARGDWVPISDPPVEVTSNESSARVDLGYPEIDFNITIGELRDINGDGIMGPGDEVIFRYEVINTGTVPLNNVNIDGDSLSLPLPGLVCTPITLGVGESAFLNCTGGAYVITPSDAAKGEVSLTGDAAGTSDAGVTVRASSAAATVTNLGLGGMGLEKLAGIETAMIGDVVPYTIRVSNPAEGVVVTARLVDTLPEGFTYRPGSARLDGASVELEESGRRLSLYPLTIAPGETRVLTLDARVSGSVRPGLHVNRARLLSGLTGADITPEATATVRILADAVLQCATVLGRVFDDVDQNGHMSRADEERGLPNVRLVAPNGLAILTDEHGRFNVPCAALPRAIGSNFMLKLDERTLPAGYRLTTENPRVVRLTPGMITRLDFGATLARLVRIDLAANAFDGDALSPALQGGLQKMVAEIRDRPVMVRLTYLLAPHEAQQEAQGHLKRVERVLRDLWAREGRYKLNIETLIQRAGAAK